MEYNLNNNDSANLGMICGGSGLVLIDCVGPDRGTVKEFLVALRELLEGGGNGRLVITVPTDRIPGWTARSCLVGPGGLVAGDPACSREDLAELAKRGGTYDRLLAGTIGATYVLPVGLQGAAYVFGAGHCGEKLVPVLNSVGFYTVVVDDRAEFANDVRFPLADRIVVPESFESIVRELPIDEDSYVIIVTRGHMHDRTVLAQALATSAGYVGMIGSRKKVAETFQALSDAGVSAEDIARVHAPIGLSIGAETPEEIAVSIVAQLIQVRASKRA